MLQRDATLTDQLQLLVETHREAGQFGQLQTALETLARSVTPDAIVVAAEPFRDDPAIIAPLYATVVERQPGNARAMVILANALWLLGAGPDVVGDLASRARAADESHRGAWHLWALSESDARLRTQRWRQVADRFPEDDLALANFADNASSVASAEQDPELLDLAIAAYDHLLSRTQVPEQREAVERALTALRGWRF